MYDLVKLNLHHAGMLTLISRFLRAPSFYAVKVGRQTGIFGTWCVSYTLSLLIAHLLLLSPGTNVRRRLKATLGMFTYLPLPLMYSSAGNLTARYTKNSALFKKLNSS
jgi:hypothetical protein